MDEMYQQVYKDQKIDEYFDDNISCGTTETEHSEELNNEEQTEKTSLE